MAAPSRPVSISLPADVTLSPNRVLPPDAATLLPGLLAIPGVPPPADFEAFWQDTRTAALRIAPEPRRHPTRATVAGYDVDEISWTSWDGARLRGWLAVPRDQPITRGIVISHGYGGRDQPDPSPLIPGAAALFPCARGLSLSASPDHPTDIPHVLRGIASRETYIFRGCVGDVWSAVSTLHELVPATRDCTDYAGSSFGGGIGALAVPWETRVRRAFLGVPSFGQHPIRLQTPCLGSGEHVRLHAQTHPEVAEVLRYYDASTAAAFIRQPTLVECALVDGAVPPAGQFAVFTALTGPRELFVRRASHCVYPEVEHDDACLRDAIRTFLRT